MFEESATIPVPVTIPEGEHFKIRGLHFRRAKRCSARKGFLCETRGVAALEFALVSPVLLLMLIGMVCLGLYFIYIHELQELSSSAARASVAGLNESERDSLAKQYVADALANSPMLNANDLTVATATSGTPATYYAVTLNYDLKDTPIPLISKIISLQLANIQRTSTIQFGNY